MDHGISTLTRAGIAFIPPGTLSDRTERHPNLGRLLWRDTLADAAIYREWVVNIGRRPAPSWIAHLLCGLVARQRALGLTRDHNCRLPLTQVELADATGLTPVHVNRTLQHLRAEGM